MIDYEKLKRRYNIAKDNKYRYLALYADLYRFILPDRNAFNVLFNYNDQGLPLTQDIFDDTAMIAANQYANDMHGLLMPSNRRWGKLTFNPQMVKDDDAEMLQPYLDEVNEKIFWYLDASNLARACSSAFQDLVGGTCGIWVESIDEQRPLVFHSIPAIALFIEWTGDDEVENCFFNQTMQGPQIIDMFPDYKGKMLDALRQNSPVTYNIIRAQIKISDHKYHICAFLETDCDTPLSFRETSYKQVHVARAQVRPGEADGRGIGMDILPTVRDLNRVQKQALQSIAFKAMPPIFYDLSTGFNPYSVRQWSGAMIPRKPGAGAPVEAMTFPSMPEVAQRIMFYTDKIQKALQVDPLGDLQQPIRSATEISVRENRAQRTSMTNIARLINELPKPIFETAARILNEWGLLRSDTIPEGLRNFNYLSFTYKSPLADLQDQNDINNFVSKAQMTQQYFGQGAVLASVNVGKVSDWMNEKLNLPSRLYKSASDIDKIMIAAAQAQQQPAATPTTRALAQPELQAAGTSP